MSVNDNADNRINAEGGNINAADMSNGVGSKINAVDGKIFGRHFLNIQKRNRRQKRVSLIVVLVIAVLSLAFYCEVGSARIEIEAAISIATCMCGTILIAVLFVLTTMDHRTLSDSDRQFLLTLMLLSWCLFALERSWFAEGQIEYAWATYFTEIIVTLSGMGMILSFYEYMLSTVLAGKRDKLKVITVILYVFAGLSSLMMLLNPITGWIFTLDAEGYEVPGPLIVIQMILVIYPLFLLGMVWVFISFYDGNRRKLELKNHDIEIADSVLKGILPKEDEDIQLTEQMQALADSHSVPDAMKLTELLTRERIRRMEEKKS